MRRDIACPSTREGLPAATEARRRVLLLSVAGLGDFVMATPALRAIRRHFPEAVVCLLTIPEVGPLVERCPYLDTVRTRDLRRSRSCGWWTLGKKRREIWQLIRSFGPARFHIGRQSLLGGNLDGRIAHGRLSVGRGGELHRRAI